MCNVKMVTGKALQPQEWVPGFDNTGTCRRENTGESGFVVTGSDPLKLRFFPNYFHAHDLYTDMLKAQEPELII